MQQELSSLKMTLHKYQLLVLTAYMYTHILHYLLQSYPV